MSFVKDIKVIIIPGNGGDKPEDKWFHYVVGELGKLGLEVINREFPDPVLARKEYWLSFLEKELQADDNTILIGHSSGAIAALRFAETYKILGSVLVSAYLDDLGIESEKQSGYFTDPWDFNAIKKNQEWIIQFASTDDPYFSIEQPRFIRDNLQTEYYEFNDRGHFGSEWKEFPELITAVKKRIIIS